MEENKGLLLKCAMSYGLAMGIYWVIKYLFLIFGYSIPSLIFIYEGLSLVVPLIAAAGEATPTPECRSPTLPGPGLVPL